MKKSVALMGLALFAMPLAACGGTGDDKLAGRVEDAADNRADQLEATAENLEDRAEDIRENGEERAEAIDDADVNADAMSNAQKADLIGNDAATVR